MSTMTGPDWLDLKPEHFNDRLLPRKHRNAPEGLFSVADVAVVQPKAAPKVSELDGQADLFSETE